MEGGIHYPHLDSRQALLQGLPVSYKGWTNFCLLDRSAYSHKFQVDENTHSAFSRLDAQTQSVLVRDHSQGAGISHLEYFSHSPTLLGFEGHRAAPDEDKRLAETNPYYLEQKSASTMVPLDQSHRSMPVGVTPNVSISSAIPSSCFVQRASRNRSHQPKITRKKRAKEPSRSSGQPSALKRPYVCHTCGKRYAQPGGVMRHYRAKHNPNSCTYCGARWSRPYQYRDHLERHHRDVDPDLVLGKPPGSRRRAEVIGRGRPQNVSPNVVEHDRQSQAAPRRSTLMSPLSAEVPLGFSSAEELGEVQPVNDVVDDSFRLPRALPGEFATANYSSRLTTAHIPFPCPPFGGYYGDLVSADPVFEPSGFIRSYH